MATIIAEDIVTWFANNKYTVLASTASVLMVSYWVLRSRKSNNLPPGPKPLPLVGNLPLLRGDDLLGTIRSLAAIHGDVFTIYIGPKPIVFLCSYEAIKDALVTNGVVFSGRPQDHIFIKEFTKGYGISSAQGEMWHEQRRFIHTVLRDLGMGRTLVEEKIQEESSHLIQGLLIHEGRPFDPTSIIGASVANIIFSIVFGKRCENDDPRFLRHIQLATENLQMIPKMNALMIFAFLKYLPGDLFCYKKMLKNVEHFSSTFIEMVNEHRIMLSEGESGNVVDAYLQEMEKRKDDTDSNFHEDQLIGIICDLFIAGSETTATFLRWALALLQHNPEVMKRIQNEIDDVIGSARMPSMKDKAMMPYTEASMHEILRFGDIAPMGGAHATLDDVKFRGFSIPKGTHVIPVFHCVHRDSATWQDPFTFRPERFIQSDGSVLRDEHLVPFGLGKRVCLGESLARTEMFLFFTIMLQRLQITCPPARPLPDIEHCVLGVTHAPKPFNVCVHPR